MASDADDTCGFIFMVPVDLVAAFRDAAFQCGLNEDAWLIEAIREKLARDGEEPVPAAE